MSYSEIKNSLSVPKSTLSYWLKGLSLTKEQRQRLEAKRLEASKVGSQNKILKISEAIETVKSSSARNINKISKRELWLMGIVLYWRERFLLGSENDRKGVHFASSDPYLIKLFLKWLQDVGKLKDDEISFDLFLRKNREKSVDKIIKYWSQVTGFSKKNFSHIYFQKKNPKRKSSARRKVLKKSRFGFLRIRVKASSMLARQISGWVRGIKQYYWSEA